MDGKPSAERPTVLVTGASRQHGIGAAIVKTLAASGWDVATTYWRPFDVEASPPSPASEATEILNEAEALGARTFGVEADLADASAPEDVFDAVESGLGPVSALVMSHGYDVESDILTTTIESFDRHIAVNARASWLLIREFARRYRGTYGRGRLIALTSDHVVGNMPYGASKGALDRITLAAAREFRTLGITANVVNPGPTDTGWMSDELRKELRRLTPLGRLGMPQDCANLVAFLCSDEGGWVNGQLLRSDGGFN